MSSIKTKTNIDAVAELAGVSKAVVSSIVGGGSTNIRFSPDTRRKVLQAALKLNYTPRTTHGIGIVHSMTGKKPQDVDWVQWISPMLASIHLEALLANKLVSVFSYSSADTGSEIGRGELPQIFRRKKIDGLILTGALDEPLLAYTAENRVPHILMNISDANAHAEDSICFDEIFTGAQATRHLLELGHRRIMHITVEWSASHYSQFSRRYGYEIAMREAGLPEQLLCLHRDNHEELFLQLKQILSQPDRPTAIFAYNEEVALLCFRVMHELKLTFSEVSVIAVGWQDVKSLEVLGISYVLLPALEMGRQCFRMILQKIENEAMTPTVSLRGMVKSLRSTGACLAD